MRHTGRTILCASLATLALTAGAFVVDVASPASAAAVERQSEFTFSGGQLTAIQVPSSVAVGDVNGDGHGDLLVPTDDDVGSLGVLLSDGSGGFGAPTFFALGVRPGGVAIGDFDRDGDLDVAVAGFSSNSVAVVLGNGSGGLARRSSSRLG